MGHRQRREPSVSGAGSARTSPAERIVVTIIVGGGAAVAAFGMSRLGDGLLEGASFLLAVFIATVTVGFVFAELANAWLGQPQEPTSVRRPRVAAGVICGCCGRSKQRCDSIWVCAVCDRVGVDR